MPVVKGGTLSRRAFLRGSLGLAASLPLAGCVAPTPRDPRDVLTGTQRETLGLVTRTLWPPVEGLPGADGADVVTRATRLLAPAPPSLQADVRQLLDVLDRMAFLGGSLRGVAGLDVARRRRYLFGWRDAGLAEADRLWAGLVRLTGTFTYMSPATWPGIGYPGPWYGRLDVGVGLRHDRPLAANPNPSWDSPHPLEPGHGA